MKITFLLSALAATLMCVTASPIDEPIKVQWLKSVRDKTIKPFAEPGSYQLEISGLSLDAFWGSANSDSFETVKTSVLNKKTNKTVKISSVSKPGYKSLHCTKDYSFCFQIETPKSACTVPSEVNLSFSVYINGERGVYTAGNVISCEPKKTGVLHNHSHIPKSKLVTTIPETLILEKKVLIIGMSFGNKTGQEFTDKFSVPLSAVHRLNRTYNERATLERQEVSGRPKALSIRDIRSLKCAVRKNRRAPLRDITNELPSKVSSVNVRRVLRDEGIFSR
ncbi:hypothetical protein BGX26_005200, partial [Mortierella sp. AD094]